MISATRIKTKYDHRIKQAIAYSGDINLFSDLEIPASTSKGWVKKGIPKVVELRPFNYSNVAKELQLKKGLKD